MYYKIENKECEVYKKLHELRTKELLIENKKIKTISEKIGLRWDIFLRHHGQQNFSRVSEYIGFQFLEPEKVDLNVWKKCKDHPTVFIPNKRTKLGKEMAKFLSNGLESSSFLEVFNILNIEHSYRYALPYIEIVEDIIVLFLDNKHIPEDENIIEITRKEFEEIRTKLK